MVFLLFVFVWATASANAQLLVMPRRIAFINYKGGVGKTSCIVNIAACFAEMGKRVLLVDLDAQSNASIWLMRLERWNKLNVNGEGSIFSIYQPGTARLKDVIFKDVVVDRTGKSVLPGLDMVPTTFNLIDIEHEYKDPPGRPPYAILREQLAEVENDYDIVLFDCPPNVMRASQIGLFNTNEVYVPSNPDALSLIGFTLLTGKLLQFNERSASFRTPGMGKPALIHGILFNSIKANVDIEVPKMRMQFRLNQFRNQKKVASSARIFAQTVRDAVVVRRAVTLGMPVNTLGATPGSEGVLEDYRNLAKQILRQGEAAATPAIA
ncbi:MAG: AAA family ATPase [Pseudomonadota bacterium]